MSWLIFSSPRLSSCPVLVFCFRSSWHLGLPFRVLLGHTSETRLIDPLPDLLPLRDPSIVYWEHLPPHSTIQAEGFLPAPTLSRLIFTLMATQAGRTETSAGAFQSHSLGVHPGSSSPAGLHWISYFTPLCLDALICKMGPEIPLIL